MHLIFKSIDIFDKYLPGYKERYLNYFLCNYDLLKNIKKPIEKIRKNLEDLKISQIDFLFFTDKYKHLIIKLKSRNFKVAVIGGYFVEQFAKEYDIPYISVYPFKKLLIDIYLEDPEIRKKETRKIIKYLISVLNIIKVRYLLLPIDLLFLERFLIFLFRYNSTKIITLQDGILFDSKKDTIPFKVWLSQKISDIFLVWGRYFYKMIKKYYKKDSYILGYPHELLKFQKKKVLKKHSICLIGQDYENYSYQLGLRKKKILENVASILKNFGFKVCYKPHPGEKLIPKNVKIINLSPTDTLKNFDIFIGINSTMLLEASMLKKISIQIESNYFAKLPVETCYSISYRNIHKLPILIKTLHSPKNVSNKIVLKIQNVDERLLNIISNYEKQCKKTNY